MQEGVNWAGWGQNALIKVHLFDGDHPQGLNFIFRKDLPDLQCLLVICVSANPGDGQVR